MCLRMGRIIENAGKRICLIFPYIADVHLTKDIGLIPYILQKYFGYESTIATNKQGEYPSLDTFVKGIKLDFMDNTGDPARDIQNYIENNALNYDYICLYGVYDFYIKASEIYKKIRSDGKIYLKLDANMSWMNSIQLNQDVDSFLKRCDLISVECKDIYVYLNKKWPYRVEYIPNGYYDFNESNRVEYKEKENIIMTAGRIGIHQKANEVLLEAFRLVSDKLPSWKLKIIGAVEEAFQVYLDDFLNKHPQILDKIIFTGQISDRRVMDMEYRKAKIFCLTSRWEGFPNVLPEAGKKGCFIISTDIEPARDITNNRKYGELFAVDNTSQLSDMFVKICNNEERLSEVCNGIQDYIQDSFDWIKICRKLDILLSNVGGGDSV